MKFVILPIALLFTVSVAMAEERVDFNRDIRPIFSKTCFACHGPDAEAREADIRLDLREAAVSENGNQPIVPGSAKESPVFQRISAEDADERMPPADFHTQLTEREKELVQRWIDQGAEYQMHWSFIPPEKAKTSGGSNAIDFFVRAKLRSLELSPQPQADRSTLIRRVSLDLTGVPPTPEDVRAFVNDPADDDKAFAKVVDRLLDTPQYAEHRTRYWLDAARYADTSGYQYDRIREQWVWRDWVIHAFDTNMPFDQFTILQTAGDLVPDASPSTRLATGFHRNHPITIEGGVIDEEYRTEYVMDRVVTSSTTWLGLTFLCARCHDHKYDPISQDDFYSLYAFFNNVPERGLNGFNPKEKIESPLRNTGFEEIDRRVAEQEKRLREEMGRLDSSFAKWEELLRKEADAELESVKLGPLTAKGGTQLERQADGSILATGANPATQTYTIEFTSTSAPVQAVQLEALTHDSLVNKSTGRATNGNFVLSEVRMEWMGDDSKWRPLEIQSAHANYEQSGYPIAAAIDGKAGRGGWAVDGNTRFADSIAVFTLKEKVPAATRIRISLDHTWGGSHAIGRFRLSVPSDGQAPVPPSIRKTLDLARGKRNADQSAALRRYLASRYAGEKFERLETELQSLSKRRNQMSTVVPETMVLTESPKPRTTFVLMRGEYDKPMSDRPVQANVPKILGGLPEGLPQNRLGLARWLVSRENPLTARVTVNRFWSQLFGSGLVKTIEDFGAQGEYPSHPRLLDWLAVEFMESGWNVKQLFRTIVMSQTYRQSSSLTAEAFARDPDNRLLARGPRHRLDAEVIRDSALVASGLLDQTIGGKSVYPYHPKGLWLEINNRPGYSRAYPHDQQVDALYRRSMYTFWKRTVPPPSMAAFDAPEREFCMVKRSRTNTPLQAFVMLHDPQFVEAARKLGERMILEGGRTTKARLEYGFALCLSRQPRATELERLERALRLRQEFYQKNKAEVDKILQVGASPLDKEIDPATLAAYATVARIIMNLSEFVTKG